MFKILLLTLGFVSFVCAKHFYCSVIPDDKGPFKGWFFNGKDDCDVYYDTKYRGFKSHTQCKKECVGLKDDDIEDLP